MICDSCTQRENNEQKSFWSPPLHVYGSQISPHFCSESINKWSITASFIYSKNHLHPKKNAFGTFQHWVWFFKIKMFPFSKAGHISGAMFDRKKMSSHPGNPGQVLRLPLGRWTQFLPNDKDKKYPSTKKTNIADILLMDKIPNNHQGWWLMRKSHYL